MIMSGDEWAYMERSHLAHYVWYINYSDTLAGVFLFIENNIYHEVGG